MRFHMTNVTGEIDRVHPKWFLSLWYVRRKPCNYLASRLALSPNRPKQASIWASLARSTIGCVQNDFRVYGSFDAHQHLSYVKIGTISKWTKTRIHLSLITYEYHRVRPKWFLSLWYVWRQPSTYLAPILTLSRNGPKWDSTWPTSSRCSIRCVQNYFWACGTFSANRAPILRQD
jgi:hypothetical protein